MANNNSIVIEKLQKEIEELKQKLTEKQRLLSSLKISENKVCPYSDGLTTEEVSRYSRQMLVPCFGSRGQIKLKQSHVLIVGAGGLGCPAALYLVAAGIGTITLLDYDQADITNLHRQILHSEYSLGVNKVDSACEKLRSINSNVEIIPILMSADSNSLKNLFAKNKFDVVLDGSDNVATRYLLNDICVLNHVPLVSGSALQMEGQLTVYNYQNGPCYRCLFPVPPPPQTVTNCGDGGVLGPVTGTIGVLQALETIKILTGMDNVLSGRLLIFDGSETQFRNIKLRNKKEDCDVCGKNPTIKDLIDYEQFCGSKAHDKVIDIDVLSNTQNINIQQYVSLGEDRIVIDVRPKIEYEFCKLPGTINIPYSYIINEKNLHDLTDVINSYKSKTSTIHFICRRGNDSQRVVNYLKNIYTDKSLTLLNISGGLYAYSKHIDPSFPIY
ncbi:adenylyltransferase and sulfurtransferase MOCS3 [Coccinella septempunctata]|uniref:adenylyltransferase and sulfurtransferase MOCS3 n=1 Tax=Coccinella septempunctata TaxID=41139 RepID=UPI001D082F5C|nr:adenylyltransferase and sulfurtransferase MOCS3 [Coccinella septempunctata]